MSPLAALQRDGYVVIPDVLGPAELEGVRAAVQPVLPGTRFGRTDFEGERTERIYNLLGKVPAIAALVEHPLILELGEAVMVPEFLLSSAQAINIHPGENAQGLHCDHSFGTSTRRPDVPLGLSTMWALTDFTADNGATRLVPGSHEWDETSAVIDDLETVAAEMTAGSVLVYLGGVYHGGGANQADTERLGISIIYCQPWMRQFENQIAAVPRDVAAGFTPRLQRMLGYSTWGPWGTVDGMDPIRLLADQVRSSVGPESGSTAGSRPE